MPDASVSALSLPGLQATPRSDDVSLVELAAAAMPELRARDTPWLVHVELSSRGLSQD
jgi:hypothetical protein